MTEAERTDLALKGILDNQIRFQKEMDKRMQAFQSLVSETLANQNRTARPSSLPNPAQRDQIIRVIGQIDTTRDSIQPPPPVPPISLRYRNDGSTGEHRLEYIFKPSPYKNGVSGALWDDADWIPIPGADAEIYTP